MRKQLVVVTKVKSEHDTNRSWWGSLVSFPSITGFANSKGKVGIIQFDAHHDLRNLEDGGPSNGTPFRSLLKMVLLQENNSFEIGIRNFSNARAYHGLCKRTRCDSVHNRKMYEREIKDIDYRKY
ncbi:arginase family protein [Bacillus paranthracis]